MDQYILVIDEGTTSTRAIAFDRDMKQYAVAQADVPLSTPGDGWVEQDGADIWQKTLSVCRDVIDQVGGAETIAAIAITNQRETTLLWDRATGDSYRSGNCLAGSAHGKHMCVAERTWP